MIGGSADLTPSNNTKTKDLNQFQKIISMEDLFIMELESMEWLLHEWNGSS